jgi:hypothetical protein
VSDPLPIPTIVLSRAYAPAAAAPLCGVPLATVLDHIREGLLPAREDGMIEGLELFKWFRAIRRGLMASRIRQDGGHPLPGPRRGPRKKGGGP